MHREQDGIEYYNSGSWTDAQATYITVDTEGVRIQEYADAPGIYDSDVEAGSRQASQCRCGT